MIKPFIHLRCLSSYSLSESTLKIKKLVNLAKKNNMPALAITDNNNMFGVFEFAQECINNNISVNDRKEILNEIVNINTIHDKKDLKVIETGSVKKLKSMWQDKINYFEKTM